MHAGNGRYPLAAVGTAAVLGLVTALSFTCGGGSTKSDDATGGIGGSAVLAGGSPGSGGNSQGTGGLGAGGSTQSGGSGAGTGGSSTGGAAGTGGSPSVNCQGVPKLKLTVVADKASDPILVTQPLGDSRLFVVERRGIIRLVADGTVSATPFLDIRNNVSPLAGNGERGLLGLAFHPGYAQNGRFFVYYTAKGGEPVSMGAEGDLVIAEGKRSANADRADTALKLVKKITHPRGNHNGGMMSFGRDGFLYAGTGDGGGGGDPDMAGQDLKQPLGKLLRIDVDNVSARPAGNMPDPADIHVFGYGLRNPWRWSFDRSNGDLYIGDVGQEAWEEIDFVKASDVKGGMNFGWSAMEGMHCYRNNCQMGGKILPVTEYENPSGDNTARAVVGGYAYRGTKIPCLVGRYLYGDNAINQVYSFVIKDGQATNPVNLTADLVEGGLTIGDISSFGEDNAGELYLVARAASTIFRIDPQ